MLKQWYNIPNIVPFVDYFAIIMNMNKIIIKRGVNLNFEVGQLAETKSFEDGYRCAWFRCKIKDIDLKKMMILPEYYDFDPAELTWEQMYQEGLISNKSKRVKRHLMVRPQYPKMYKKTERPPLDSISQVCVVVDGTWKVGDLVDWRADDCYWSVTVVKVLSSDKFQVELPRPPLGNGEEGKEGTYDYEACCKDFRPSLFWSATKGWTLPTVEGRTAGNAQLIFPTKQGMDLEPEAEPEPMPVPAAAGSTTHTSAEGDKDSEQNEESVKMDCDLGMDLEPQPGPEPDPEPAAAGSTTRISAEGDRDSEQNKKSEKMDCDVMESSDSISSLQKKVAVDEVEKRDLNIMHEDTLDAAVIDLQELVTKVKWMQRLLQSPSNDATPSSWKFV